MRTPDRLRAPPTRTCVAGVRLRATDADLSIGDGPEATGPALSLLLAVAGRPVAGGEPAGQGTELLSARARAGRRVRTLVG